MLKRLGVTWVSATLLSASLLFPARGAAQTLSGTLTSPSTGQGVARAQVSLKDVNQRRVALTFSDSVGNFSLRVAGSGVHELHVDALGYSSLVVTLQLDPGQSYTRRLELAAAPVQLESIVGRGPNPCGKTRTTVATALLWEDVRKALETVLLAGELPKVTYSAVEYTRNLDRWKKVHAVDSSMVKLVGTRGPYLSLPVDSLLDRGFVQPDPSTGAFAYFGPDAEVLLSSRFLGTYCFEQAPPSARRGQVGLKFRQLKGDTIPGIRGTIWADANTRELRSVEFKYDQLPVPDPEIDAGGIIEFTRLAEGPWIVTRWVLTAPRFVEQMRANGGGKDLIFTTYRQLERVVNEGRFADGNIAYQRQAVRK